MLFYIQQPIGLQMAQQIRAELPHRAKPNQTTTALIGIGIGLGIGIGWGTMAVAMAMTATMMVLSAWKTIATFNEAPYDFLKSIQEDN